MDQIFASRLDSCELFLFVLYSVSPDPHLDVLIYRPRKRGARHSYLKLTDDSSLMIIASGCWHHPLWRGSSLNVTSHATGISYSPCKHHELGLVPSTSFLESVLRTKIRSIESHCKNLLLLADSIVQMTKQNQSLALRHTTRRYIRVWSNHFTCNTDPSHTYDSSPSSDGGTGLFASSPSSTPLSSFPRNLFSLPAVTF